MQILTFLKQGGPIMGVLAGFSLIGLTLALWKFYQYLRAGILLGRAQPTGCTQSGRRRHPVALLVEAVRQHQPDEVAGAGSWQDEVQILARRQLRPLEQGLRGLETIAAVSPLVGLLGTVCGMIVAFASLETAKGQVSPALLAGGIWEAMLTTAAGLAIAIPAKLIVVYLDSRLEQVREALEETATRLSASKPPAISEASQ